MATNSTDEELIARNVAMLADEPVPGDNLKNPKTYGYVQELVDGQGCARIARPLVLQMRCVCGVGVAIRVTGKLQSVSAYTKCTGCERRYEYRCWKLRRYKHATVHQVDAVEIWGGP